MSISITIDLSDGDLKHFTDVMQRAQKRMGDKSAEAVIEAAGKLLNEGKGSVPAYIAERLGMLDKMIMLVKDAGFALPDEDRKRVLSCLAYFCDPDDLIADSVPVLGFLDDAIMIELCQRELKHELEAYEDFSDFRATEARKQGVDPANLYLQRVEWAEARRVELIDRMHRRRRAGYGNAGGQWEPVLFRVT
ncbi:MAG: YkvA family protein [Dokdonella sp.]